MRPGLTAVLILLAIGGLALRLPQLDRRPMHADEAVHAVKFLGLWERGEYQYDPHEYHGPFLYYATLPWAWASGARDRAALRESTLRLTAVVAGTLLILAVWLARDGLGWGPILAGALGTAVSPAMVFYSRYFIHELWLVLFSFVFLAALGRYWRSPGPGPAVLGGAALGLMHATKETFVLVLFSAAVAVVVMAWTRVSPMRRDGASVPRWGHLGWALGAAALVSTALFTSLGSHWRGPWDSVLTYLPWLQRAEGQSPHVHPWYYYLQLLGWYRQGQGPTFSEGLFLVLGLLGVIFAFRRRVTVGADPAWVRFLAIYTVVLTACYSVIPYKTPWCLLGFLHGWILLAAYGAVCAVAGLRSRWSQVVGVAVLTLAVVQLGVQSWRASYPYAESQRNPYVYAHTSSSLLELVEKIREITRSSPEGDRTVIQVIAGGGDYWPLPWYLREFGRVGWYPTVPEQLAGAIVIASPSFAPDITARAGDRIQSLGYFGLRPSRFLQLHVESSLWERYLREQRAAP